MIEDRRTLKQIKTKEHNDKHFIIYFTSARHIATAIKNDKSILQKINPRWNCLSHYFNFCLLRDFGTNRKINDKEQELKDQIRVLREELNATVSEMNRSIMFFDDQLTALQENNIEELGILKRPGHREDC